MVDGLRRRLGLGRRPRKNDCPLWRTGESVLNRHERRLFSQNGEDGILEAIFERVKPLSQTFVEFGVEDGSECNTAYLVRNKRWSGYFIEGDPVKYRALERNYRRYSRVKTANEMITAENIVPIFERLGVPLEFDLLSIDIDGNDYWVWRALKGYRPRVVSIEFNLAFPPPTRWVMAYNPDHRWDDTSYFGASLSSLCALGEKMGYAFLTMDCNAVNAFFLRKDLLADSGLESPRPEEVFHFPPSFPRHPYRAGRSVEL